LALRSAVEPTGVDPQEWQKWRGVENDHVLIYLGHNEAQLSLVADLFAYRAGLLRLGDASPRR
jgi:hypothetical protein